MGEDVLGYELKLPHRRFNRRIGAYSSVRLPPDGKMAGWIAPPARGIDGKPVDLKCVKFG
jgi:hypothetical protein